MIDPNSFPDSPVVSPQWLHQHIDNVEVVPVDCRFALADLELGDRQYAESHIPGARYLNLDRDLSAPVERHGGRHPLPDPAKLAAKLGEIGIASGKTLVVAYDDSRFAFAARLWWLLRYLGHDRAAVLDGGLAAWQQAGYPVTAAVPVATPATFVPDVRSHWVADLEAVKQRKEKAGVVLVDSRDGDRYRGDREPIDPVAGRIPGAVNLPWKEVTGEGGALRSPEELRQRWQPASEAEEIIVYCGSGVTACTNLLSLAVAGIDTGKLYAGSWSDWCSYPENPVATGD